MAEFQKIDRIPEDIWEHKAHGRHLTPETKAFSELHIGEVLQFKGDRREIECLRKKLESYARRHGWNARVCQKNGILYAERTE